MGGATKWSPATLIAAFVQLFATFRRVFAAVQWIGSDQTQSYFLHRGASHQSQRGGCSWPQKEILVLKVVCYFVV